MPAIGTTPIPLPPTPEPDESPMPRQKTASLPMTTAAQLGGIVKSARQIMCKDKGLPGELEALLPSILDRAFKGHR